MSLGIHSTIIPRQTHGQRISRLVNHCRDTGSVQVMNCLGRPSLLSDDNLDRISQNFLRCPQKSLIVRELSLQSKLRYGSE